MEAEKVHITKEMETYLSTLYARALDYRAENPILGDKISDDIVRRIDFDLSKMGLPKGSEVTLPIRAKLFDQWTREFLAANPASRCYTWAAAWTAASAASTRRPRSAGATWIYRMS